MDLGEGLAGTGEQASLFASTIRRVRQCVDTGPVMSGKLSSNSARPAIGDGIRWIRKRAEEAGSEELVAEGIAWQCAHQLGARVPLGAYYLPSDDPEDLERSWLSEVVPDVVSYDASRLESVINIEDLGPILVLDALLFIGDRVEKNLILQAYGDETKLRLWGMDFGASRVRSCSARDLDAVRDEVPPGLLRWPRAMRERLEPSAVQCADRIASWSERTVRSLIADPVAVGGRDIDSEFLRLLHERCSSVDALRSKYFDRIFREP
jgi:hypothetical protein